jgi:type IV secretory pathway VirB2 component (pilin)
MPDSIQRVSRSNRETTVVSATISSARFRQDRFWPWPPRWLAKAHIATFIAVLFLLPSLAFAQLSPWERAASNLEFTFTGPLARSLALVSIVIGGLMFMFGEGGAKRQISGIVFGGGLALFAAQFMTWLF